LGHPINNAVFSIEINIGGRGDKLPASTCYKSR